MNEIVEKSGAPRGSIYYHFPGGKEEIASEAVLFAGRTLAGRIRDNLAGRKKASQAIREFVSAMSFFVALSGFRSGGPLAIVASETATTHPRLNRSCRQAYAMIRGAFREKLRAYAFSEPEVEMLALSITAAIEGGIILTRTYHARKPLLAVARLLERALHSLESRE